ncbi:WhiB family transcriptional regulator [Nocardia vulneris]|uniref:WhiB family transcriptional regulator n=1 Tax=Nocardia vulneris TaxID=1141657 RepID=UPI0005BA8A96|nr:WhiB family transcriptional regulator [Nocardia vulneris]
MTGVKVDRISYRTGVSGHWRQRAKCAGDDADIWFDSSYAALAKETCSDCPVRRECGEVADDSGEQFGIRAGFDLSDPVDRILLKKSLGRAAPSAPGICAKCGGRFRPGRYMRQLCPACRGLADADPVRAHLAELEAAGMPRPVVAEAASVSPQLLWRLVTPKYGKLQQFISAVAAKRIMAVAVPQRAAEGVA